MMSEARQIGAALPAIRPTTEHRSSGSVTSAFLDQARALLARPAESLSETELAVLDTFGHAPLPALPTTDESHFAKCLRTLAILPSRADDPTTAELRFALYFRHFGKLPMAALNYLTERATLECRFFPSPAECKAILDQWERRDEAVNLARSARVQVFHERQRRFDNLLSDVATGKFSQDEIDALPDRIKRISEDKGALRYVDGRYVQRTRHGGEWQTDAP